MPIHPEDRDRYPSDWRKVSNLIRFGRARGRCEQTIDGVRCGAPHGAIISRMTDDPAWWAMVEPPHSGDPADYGTPEKDMRALPAQAGGGRRPIKVVLTVSHLDHSPENTPAAEVIEQLLAEGAGMGDARWANLRAMCQRCHLRYDRDHHRRSRRRRRSQKDLDL